MYQVLQQAEQCGGWMVSLERVLLDPCTVACTWRACFVCVGRAGIVMAYALAGWSPWTTLLLQWHCVCGCNNDSSKSIFSSIVVNCIGYYLLDLVIVLLL